MRETLTPPFAGLPLRTRFLLVLVLGAVVPLGLIGWWLVHSSGRAGEILLRTQLEEALATQELRFLERWKELNGDLLLFAENDVVWRLLAAPPVEASQPPPWLAAAFRTAHRGISSIRYDDRAGMTRLELSTDEERRSAMGATDSGPPSVSDAQEGRAPAFGPGTYSLSLPVTDPSGATVGSMHVELGMTELIGPGQALTVPGAVLLAFDSRSGAGLLSSPLEPELSANERFEWNDDDWLRVRRQLSDPPIEFRLAAPLDPFVEPFARTARIGGTALLLVSLLVVLVTTYLTARITRSIVEATRAAEAIASGDLDHRIPVTRTDEVGRLSRALNTMADSLRSTLDALSRQRTLGALGEFATSLAHEVRNAHTAVGVDLERATEQARDRPDIASLLVRALRRVRSVNRTVDAALRIARSGKIEARRVNLNDVMDSAVRATQPWFAEREAQLVATHDLGPVHVLGDPDALEALFVNLLRNAAQALEPQGRAELFINGNESAVEVHLRDNGEGMSPDQLAKAFQPFSTSRPGGTGLGLPIARQIAYAHGGDVEIESQVGSGTHVRIRLAKVP